MTFALHPQATQEGPNRRPEVERQPGEAPPHGAAARQAERTAPLLLAWPAAGSAIRLRWLDQDGDVANYGICRSAEVGRWTLVATLPPTTTSYVDEGLDPNTAYAYIICRLEAAPTPEGPRPRWSNMVAASPGHPSPMRRVG